MNRAEMVNAIYDKERIRSELISRELWQQLVEMTDEEVKQKYAETCVPLNRWKKKSYQGLKGG